MGIEGRPIYAGISGASLEVDSYPLGAGVTISKTYAHFMAPFIMAFAPAPTGKPHPGPWKAVRGGGLGFDIHAEIYIPKEFDLPMWFDALNTAWWLTALIRLRTTPLAFVPVISDMPFSQVRESGDESELWPMEVATRRLNLLPERPSTIGEQDLGWIDTHWVRAGLLMRDSPEFSLAMNACDHSTFASQPSLALVSLWGALEGLFFAGRTELRFRVSALIAAYLEPPGPGRLGMQKQVAKLYDARSSAAHGRDGDDGNAVHETFVLMRRVLTRMIELHHVPSRDDLEELLLGGAWPPPSREGV